MLKKSCFAVLGVALASASLTGCCFECFESSDSSFLFFAFSADSLGNTGFRRAELRSAYAVIYSSSGFQGLRDTLRQLPPNAPATTSSANSLLLYPSTTPPGMMTFHVYAQPGHPLSYRIFVPTAGRVYEVDNVSHTLAKDRCRCQTVKEKQFTVNGQLEVVPASDPAVVLSR